MKPRSPSPPPSGSGHRKRKRGKDTAQPNRRDSTRESERRRSPDGDEIRQWTFSPKDLSAYKRRFVVVSYNLLGVDNASKHSHLYHQVSLQHLNWGLRKRRIHKELNRYNPSILCFQEVDRFNDLADLFSKDGYIGVYKGRTGDASDGCATFWKEKDFSLVHQENIEYRLYGLQDNVAQLCVLKVCCSQSDSSRDEDTEPKSSQTIVVGNIHVLFNPKRGDKKLGQIRLLLERMHSVSQQWGNAPVVICGDLNSMPQSALYQFLSSPELDLLMHDRKRISGWIEHPLRYIPHLSIRTAGSRPSFCMPNLSKFNWSEKEVKIASGSRGCTRLQNPLELFSAYKGIPGCRSTRDKSGEPSVTSYHSKFMGTVDYIWHSTDLIPAAVLETLPLQTLRKLGGLPSEKWGSDHLALVCEFAIVNDASLC